MRAGRLLPTSACPALARRPLLPRRARPRGRPTPHAEELLTGQREDLRDEPSVDGAQGVARALPVPVPPVDVLAGGFPCQPVSQAGKRLAQADERWLWPAFAECIRVLRPRYVLVENVPGLLSSESYRRPRRCLCGWTPRRGRVLLPPEEQGLLRAEDRRRDDGASGRPTPPTGRRVRRDGEADAAADGSLGARYGLDGDVHESARNSQADRPVPTPQAAAGAAPRVAMGLAPSPRERAHSLGLGSTRECEWVRRRSPR